MKNKVFKILKNINFWISFAVATIGLFGFIQGFMLYKITLPVWVLLLIALTLPIILNLIKVYISFFSRIYKLRDEVSILNEPHKLIVLRYSYWMPYRAVCLCPNGKIITIHQQFLTPFAESRKMTLNDYAESISKTLYPNELPISEITRL